MSLLVANLSWWEVKKKLGGLGFFLSLVHLDKTRIKAIRLFSSWKVLCTILGMCKGVILHTKVKLQSLRNLIQLWLKWQVWHSPRKFSLPTDQNCAKYAAGLGSLESKEGGHEDFSNITTNNQPLQRSSSMCLFSKHIVPHCSLEHFNTYLLTFYITHSWTPPFLPHLASSGFIIFLLLNT